MISLCYILAYFYNGGFLPWSDITSPREPFIDDKDPEGYKKKLKHEREIKKHFENIAAIKEKSRAADMCPGIPAPLRIFIDYCLDLKFEQKPDYENLYNLLQSLFRDQGFFDDGQWEWITVKREMLEQRAIAEEEMKRRRRMLTTVGKHTNQALLAKMETSGIGYNTKKSIQEHLKSQANQVLYGSNYGS